MTKTFAEEFHFDHSARAIHDALTSRAHWERRLAEVGDQVTTMTGFVADAESTTVTAATEIATALLPRGAARASDITFDFEERWFPLTGDTARGIFTGSITLARMVLDSAFTLTATGPETAVLTLTGEITAKLPVFGKAVEEGVLEQTVEGFARNCAFIDRWVAEHTTAAGN